MKSYFFGQTQTYPDVTIDRFGQENNFEMTKVQMCVPGNMHGRSVSARGPETGNQSTHTHMKFTPASFLLMQLQEGGSTTFSVYSLHSKFQESST